MRTAIAIVCVAAACASALGGAPAPAAAAAVAALRDSRAGYDAWEPVLELGKPAVGELTKLLAVPSHRVRAHAAVLLYRLGDASALDALAALLDSDDPEARREAAAGLLAFVGEPMHLDPAAPAPRRAAALARWKAWWQANRKAALARPPMKALHGKILAVDPVSRLVALSLGGRHGAKRGMKVNARRGPQAVCQLEIVAAPPETAVARIVALSARSTPRPGDPVFVRLP